MLAIWGLITIVGLIAAIASRRTSPMAALVLVPTTTAILSGFGLRTAEFILSGIRTIAPVVVMFLFAILFFGILTDAGLMKPLIRFILRIVGKRPLYIVPGTALIALLIHLDGYGAVVFLIAISTLLPLYLEVGMDRRVLACARSLAAGVNFLPWTGQSCEQQPLSTRPRSLCSCRYSQFNSSCSSMSLPSQPVWDIARANESRGLTTPSRSSSLLRKQVPRNQFPRVQDSLQINCLHISC